jgi:cyclopropane fatty-acyl-phospholipid synthase-like methyltransferase
MQKTSTTADGWFKRCMMRMTRWEKRAVNDARHAEHTIRTAPSLLEHAALPPQPQCLEIGCGQVALARLLVERLDARVIARRRRGWVEDRGAPIVDWEFGKP